MFGRYNDAEKVLKEKAEQERIAYFM